MRSLLKGGYDIFLCGRGVIRILCDRLFSEQLLSILRRQETAFNIIAEDSRIMMTSYLKSYDYK